MKALVHRWTRLLALPVVVSAVLGLTNPASAGAAITTGTQTTGTTTVSVDTFTDVSNSHYSNTGTLLSGQVTINPRSVTGSGQIAGATGGRLSFSIALFRFSTTPGSAGSGWYTLYDPSAGVVFFCPVLGGASWDASSVSVEQGCYGLIGWKLDPFLVGLSITETA